MCERKYYLKGTNKQKQYLLFVLFSYLTYQQSEHDLYVVQTFKTVLRNRLCIFNRGSEEVSSSQVTNA